MPQPEGKLLKLLVPRVGISCALLALGLLFLTACNLTPDFRRPDVQTPAQWHDTSLSTQKSAVDPQWWQAFGSNELNRLQVEALAYNNDLAAARQRVVQAKAQARIAGANLWPALGLQGNASDNFNNDGVTQKQAGQFSVAYEVDLWGANRARRDAGSARLLGEVFARDALQLAVMSQVSQAYFNLLALAERKRIALGFLQNVVEALAIIEARHQAGAVSLLDVVQQQTELASAQASLELLNQQYTLAEHVLTLLLGHPPQQRSFKGEAFFGLLLPMVNAPPPAALLERRPDVRQVEMELMAANADIGVARAAFYPKLQLNLDTLLAAPQPAGVALALASNLTQPLFQGGRLEGGLAYAQAQKVELVESYRKTILTAFKEVEDANTIRNHSTLRLQALTDAVDKAGIAYQRSLDRYRLGGIDYQTLLTTQRNQLTAENSRVQARLDVLLALVQLYQALGGGWPSR